MTATGRHLFALLLALYVLTAGGYLASNDEETMYRVGRNLSWGQGLAIGWERLVLPLMSNANYLPSQPLLIESTSIAPGRADGLYGRSFLGQSLLALPLFGLGGLLDRWWSVWPQLGFRFVVSLFNPVVLAITAWLLFHFVVQLGYSARVALATALGYGLSTMVWPYVNTFYPQPATGLFLLLAAFCFHRWQTSRRSRWGWGLGFALGLALLVRFSAMIVLPPAALVLWLETRRWSERFRLAWQVGLPLAGAVGISLLYNWLRFGSPLDSGYYEVAWTTPPLLGLYGLLFSAGKGVFLYSPLLLLSLAALPLFFQQHFKLALLILLWWIVYLAFYSPYNFWTGGVNWGPRFLLPLVALSMLPVATLLGQRRRRLIVPLFVLLFGLGLLIQLPAVVVDHVRYLTQQQETGDEKFYNRTLYRPAFSPIIRQVTSASAVLQNFAQSDRRRRAAEILQHQIELPPADTPANRHSAQRVLQTRFVRLNLPAIWWLHLPLWGVSTWVVAGLALPWLGLLGWGAKGLILDWTGG